MLLLGKQIYGTHVEASDGKMGKVCDILFDEQGFGVRALVLDAGTWLHSRRVTLPPDLIKRKDWLDHQIFVEGISRELVMQAPNAESHIPVGQQERLEEATIVDWGVYWTETLFHPWQVTSDPHIRNTQEVTGYHLQCQDGPIGHIADLVIDDESWKVRFLACDTRNWWPGKHVLVGVEHIDTIRGRQRVVNLSLLRERLEHSPEYNNWGRVGELDELLASAAQ